LRQGYLTRLKIGTVLSISEKKEKEKKKKINAASIYRASHKPGYM